MRSEENFVILNAFLSAESSKRLFVYYQSPDVQNEVIETLVSLTDDPLNCYIRMDLS